MLQHWDRQDKGFEFTYPPPDEEPLDSAVYMAFNKSGSGYRKMLRLEKENYRWVGAWLLPKALKKKKKFGNFETCWTKGYKEKTIGLIQLIPKNPILCLADAN